MDEQKRHAQREAAASISDRLESMESHGAEPQRRQAFRVNMRMAAHVIAPFEGYAELIDISVTGARFDRELPCTPGVTVTIVLEVPTYGGGGTPEQIEVEGTVIRRALDMTAIRFDRVGRYAGHQLQKLVQEQQRLALIARHYENERKLRGA